MLKNNLYFLQRMLNPESYNNNNEANIINIVQKVCGATNNNNKTIGGFVELYFCVSSSSRDPEYQNQQQQGVVWPAQNVTQMQQRME